MTTPASKFEIDATIPIDPLSESVLNVRYTANIEIVSLIKKPSARATKNKRKACHETGAVRLKFAGKKIAMIMIGEKRKSVDAIFCPSPSQNHWLYTLRGRTNL